MLTCMKKRVFNVCGDEHHQNHAGPGLRDITGHKMSMFVPGVRCFLILVQLKTRYIHVIYHTYPFKNNTQSYHINRYIHGIYIQTCPTCQKLEPNIMRVILFSRHTWIQRLCSLWPCRTKNVTFCLIIKLHKVVPHRKLSWFPNTTTARFVDDVSA